MFLFAGWMIVYSHVKRVWIPCILPAKVGYLRTLFTVELLLKVVYVQTLIFGVVPE